MHTLFTYNVQTLKQITNIVKLISSASLLFQQMKNLFKVVFP